MRYHFLQWTIKWSGGRQKLGDGWSVQGERGNQSVFVLSGKLHSRSCGEGDGKECESTVQRIGANEAANEFTGWQQQDGDDCQHQSSWYQLRRDSVHFAIWYAVSTWCFVCFHSYVCLPSPADRAKQIQNFAKINTDSTEKIIRDLKEENEKLKRLLEQETAISQSASPTEYYGMFKYIDCVSWVRPPFVC